MPRAQANQFLLRYRKIDSLTGVTRSTVQRLANHLGVDETSAILLALREFALKHLPRYEADDGPLTEAQLRRIRRLAPSTRKVRVASSLFD